MATTGRMTPKRQEVLEMLRRGCTLVVHARLSRTPGPHGATLVWAKSGEVIDSIAFSGGFVSAEANGESVVTCSKKISFTIVEGLEKAGLITPVRHFNKERDWVYALTEAGSNPRVPVVVRPQWGG